MRQTITRDEFKDQFIQTIGTRLHNIHFYTVLYKSFSSQIPLEPDNRFLSFAEKSCHASIVLQISKIYDKRLDSLTFKKFLITIQNNLQNWRFNNSTKQIIQQKVNQDINNYIKNRDQDEILKDIFYERNKTLAHLDFDILKQQQKVLEELSRKLEEKESLDNFLDLVRKTESLKNYIETNLKDKKTLFDFLYKIIEHEPQHRILESFINLSFQNPDIYKRLTNVAEIDLLALVDSIEESSNQGVENTQDFLSQLLTDYTNQSPIVKNSPENFLYCVNKGLTICNEYIQLLELETDTIQLPSQEKVEEFSEKSRTYFQRICQISFDDLDL